MVIPQTKARVFISCGQIRESDEERIAREIENRLHDLGYEPYVAVRQQNLSGIKEAIFAKLAASEYFVFIDFKREQLANQVESRGSIFSHQELAIASFLSLEVIAFQENGVKKLDGLIGFLQANPLDFSDRAKLVDQVVSEVEKKWKANWRKELSVERPDLEQHDDVDRVGLNNITARFWHIDVKNLDNRTPAINCYGYLERVVDVRSNIDISFESVEYKWRGFTFPNALIGPGKIRKLDAFWVFHNDPGRTRFNPFTDWTGCHPVLACPGQYDLTYAIVSENFPVARATFRLILDGTLEGIRFMPTNN